MKKILFALMFLILVGFVSAEFDNSLGGKVTLKIGESVNFSNYNVLLNDFNATHATFIISGSVNNMLVIPFSMEHLRTAPAEIVHCGSGISFDKDFDAIPGSLIFDLSRITCVAVNLGSDGQNSSCLVASDCRVTSCGDCVNKDQLETKFCGQPAIVLPYTLSCKCESNKCESVKNFKTFNLSNGRKAEIKVMPETASQKAIERLGELNFTVVLKEVGGGNNTRVVYEITAEKEGRMLGLFKVKANVSVEVDAEGQVKQLSALPVKKPWWAFLATDI